MPPDHRPSMFYPLCVLNRQTPVPVYCNGLQIQDSVHKLCGTEEDVLGTDAGCPCVLGGS